MTSDDGSIEPNKYIWWAFPLLGWCMIGHFVFLMVRTFLYGTLDDLFWISHVGTLLGGLGALFRNHRLISVSLVALFSHHLFWYVDTLGWLLSGNFPFGTTGYLEEATLGGWLQSANHFFSVPFLFFLAYWQNGVDRHAWVWSTAIFAFLASISFFFLSPEANVNSVHRLWPGLDQTPLRILQNLPGGFYLIFLVMLNGFGNYLPTNLILRGVYGIVLKPEMRHECPSKNG
jgi:hypothetical protein